MPVRAETQATPEPIEHEQAKHTTQEIGEGVKNGVKKTSKHCGTFLLIRRGPSNSDRERE